jgi:hypothetical protein
MLTSIKRSIFLLIPIMLIFWGSCSKENADFRLPGLDIPMLTGYYMRDYSGYPIGTIGTPNVYLGNESNEFSSAYFFSVYPNPAYGNCGFY